MKIGLDTSYFLYGFNIQPGSNIPQNCLDLIVQKPDIIDIYFSDLVIFELNAKASKINSDCDNYDINTEKLLQLDGQSKFKICNSNSAKIWNLSCYLRKFHNDFIDCLHYSTAIYNECIYFLSEDKIIDKLYKTPKIKLEIKSKYGYLLPEVINFKKFLNL